MPRFATLARSALFVSVVLLTACANIHAITAQTLDCDEDDVWVSDDEGFGPGDHDWDAKCGKKPYKCHASGGVVTCTPRGRGETKTYYLPPPAPPPQH